MGLAQIFYAILPYAAENSFFVVKYEVRLENGAEIFKCDEGLEFHLEDGKLKLLMISCMIRLHMQEFSSFYKF